MFEMSEGQLVRFELLSSNLEELQKLDKNFDEKCAKEIAMYLTESQEDIYLQCLEEGLAHDEAWERATAIRDTGVSLEDLSEDQRRRYKSLIKGFFREDDALELVTEFTEEQQEWYINLLGDGFGPDDAWAIVKKYDLVELTDEQEKYYLELREEGLGIQEAFEVAQKEVPIDETDHSPGQFLESLEDVEEELFQLKQGRARCNHYMSEHPPELAEEKRNKLKDLDSQIARLEYLKKQLTK